ncbi:Mgp12p SCDLUD_004595 [Saccharomycodes ludwigii]|uniref:Mgp12p n=1 Tax=Saccharomycodes ludwigii TaxID=36035 RepID=UPI001E83F8EC|nr:hypothetical protein SCDLUD_004595 [Saccharomycodes ludwigii]KAH3899166.1 hypothetical protein SCDLUD_004595 [Saccharomycodes ludwigii]
MLKSIIQHNRTFHSTTVSLFNKSNIVQNRIKLTLFVKENCGLCEKAKYNLEQLYSKDKEISKLPLELVDINLPLNNKWWDKYSFDIPVLHIENTEKPENLAKIFHVIEENDVVDKVNGVKSKN